MNDDAVLKLIQNSSEVQDVARILHFRGTLAGNSSAPVTVEVMDWGDGNEDSRFSVRAWLQHGEAVAGTARHPDLATALKVFPWNELAVTGDDRSVEVDHHRAHSLTEGQWSSRNELDRQRRDDH